MRLIAAVLLVALVAGCAGGEDTAVRVDVAQAERVPAPELVGTSLDGDEVVVDGGPVVVNFWASWCGPCVAEAPHLAAISSEYADRGVTVVGVNVDTDVASARTFERDHDIPFPSIHDPTRSVASAFGRAGPAGLPTTIVLDAEHRVASRLLGSVTARELAPRLDSLLDEA